MLSFALPIHNLGEEAKRIMYHVMNKESREAVYCFCCAMESECEIDGCDGLNDHSDTKPTNRSDLAKMPYVEGAGILVVSTGMPQLLYTRRITSALYSKPETLSPLEIPTAELVHGSVYYLDAGAVGSTDWLNKHSTWRHPDSRPGERRLAFVFRAIKPEHAREYKLRYPHRMVDVAHGSGPEIWM